jgi:hypothetical protein
MYFIRGIETTVLYLIITKFINIPIIETVNFIKMNNRCIDALNANGDKSVLAYNNSVNHASHYVNHNGYVGMGVVTHPIHFNETAADVNHDKTKINAAISRNDELLIDQLEQNIVNHDLEDENLMNNILCETIDVKYDTEKNAAANTATEEESQMEVIETNLKKQEQMLKHIMKSTQFNNVKLKGAAGKWALLKKTVHNREGDFAHIRKGIKFDIYKLLRFTDIKINEDAGKYIPKVARSDEDNSFEAYLQRQEAKKTLSKKQITRHSHDPNYIKFTTICQALPIYDPSQLVIGFEKYFISKKQYEPLYMHKHGLKKWLEHTLQLEYIQISTKLFWKTSPLLHNKTFTRVKGKSKYVQVFFKCLQSFFSNIVVNMSNTLIYIQTDFRINRGLVITLYCGGFTVTAISLLIGNREFVWMFLNVTIILVTYFCCTLMCLFSKAFGHMVKTPCIPIPDFLVLKIYKTRVDLHFLIWKESFYYAGNDRKFIYIFIN